MDIQRFRIKGTPERFPQKLLMLLRTQDWRTLAVTPDGQTAFIRAPFSGRYQIWTISDNGGELNVERVNDLDFMASVAFTEDTNADTMFMRVMAVSMGRRSTIPK